MPHSSSLPHVSCPEPELTQDVAVIEHFLLTCSDSLCERLLHYIPWPELTLLSATSTLVRSIIELYRSRAWDIEDFLYLWFDEDVSLFRSMLALSGAVVTGDQMLRFFDRRFPDTHAKLDIVTRLGGAGSLVLFLERNGYSLEPDGPSIHSQGETAIAQVFEISSCPAYEQKGRTNGVLSVLEFCRPLGVRPSTWLGPDWVQCARVRIVVVAQDPIDHIILNYHSRVMNFMTHREAVSMFPSLTFLKRTFHVCSRRDLGYNWDPIWLDTYLKEGFTYSLRDSDPGVKLGTRSVKDKSCWVIPFPDAVGDKRIMAEEARSVYGPNDIEHRRYELVWMSENVYGYRQWRVCIFEPKIFWYLIKCYGER